MLLLTHSALHAQTVNTYTNTDTTSNNIDGTRVCTTAPLIRTFVVIDNFTVVDVNIGLIATHTWRGDMRMVLESPLGTRVQITNGDATFSGSADDFNGLLDDEATGSVVNVVNVDHDTGEPPYEFDLTPNNALSLFDGENSNGTWTLEICDIFPGADNGQFLRSDLFLTAPLALQVEKISTVVNDPINDVSNPKSIPGALVEYCITISNPNSLAITSISAVDTIPSDSTFQSGSIRSGASCATASTVEDDNNSGSDESDPIGASIATGTITITRATLNATQSFAVTFEATIN